MFHVHKLDRIRATYTDSIYAIFRVLVGVLFMFHGLQKLFGMWSNSGAQPVLSFMGVVGLVELISGIFLVMGMFTSFAAIFSAVIVTGAFTTVHFTLANPWPIANRGELALLYLACFLYIMVAGGGKYSLDAWLKK